LWLWELKLRRRRKNRPAVAFLRKSERNQYSKRRQRPFICEGRWRDRTTGANHHHPIDQGLCQDGPQADGTEGGGYRRDYLRALAQRVEVDAQELRIMGSKSELLRALVAASSAKTAGFGVPSSVPKWRARSDSNAHPGFSAKILSGWPASAPIASNQAAADQKPSRMRSRANSHG
jgi:hypothetical protein